MNWVADPFSTSHSIRLYFGLVLWRLTRAHFLYENMCSIAFTCLCLALSGCPLPTLCSFIAFVVTGKPCWLSIVCSTLSIFSKATEFASSAPMNADSNCWNDLSYTALNLSEIISASTSPHIQLHAPFSSTIITALIVVYSSYLSIPLYYSVLYIDR